MAPNPSTTTRTQPAAKAAWYVIQCKAGDSFRASEHLSHQGYEVFHPLLECQRRRRGKMVTVCEPLFPYYLFIRMDQVNSNWRPIRSTRGVLRIVSFGHVPAAMPEHLIEQLKRCPSTSDGIHTRFSAGDSVQITDGPFKGLDAVFQHAKGTERAVVLLGMLQHQRPVEMPGEHLL